VRVVLVHYHLFKNAGTSLDHALRTSLRDRFEAWDPLPDAGPADLVDFLDRRPRLLAVSSHTLLLPAPEVPDLHVIPVLFLRHPLDRARSVYEYESRQDADTPWVRTAHSTDITGYVDWRLTWGNGRDPTIADYQAHRLAPAGTGATILERALDALDRLPFVGLVEAYAASLARLDGYVGGLPDLVLQPVRKNATAPPDQGLAERLALLRDRLGDERMARLIERNADDLALWDALRRRYGLAPVELPRGSAIPVVSIPGPPPSPAAGGQPALATYRDIPLMPFTELLASGPTLALHQGGPIWPDWDDEPFARHHLGGRVADARPRLREPERVVDGPVAWLGPISPHFGHQVADFSMRLLGTRVVRPDVTFVAGVHPHLRPTPVWPGPAFWRDILAWLGIPRSDVRILERPALVRELLVAPQAEQVRGPGPSEWHLDRMDELTQRRLGSVPSTGTIYVSRAGQQSHMAGEPALEDAMRRCGVTVIRPETLPLRHQLRRYLGAERLIFAEGSAMHALQLLGRLPAGIVGIHRRRGFRVAHESLVPRAAWVTWVDATTDRIEGLRANGEPEYSTSLSLIDRDRLVEGLSAHVPGIADRLTAAMFREAQEQDVARWLTTLDPRVTAPPGSVAHILDGLDDAGLGRLVRLARRVLA
jgi:hypothetical protein